MTPKTKEKKNTITLKINEFPIDLSNKIRTYCLGVGITQRDYILNLIKSDKQIFNS